MAEVRLPVRMVGQADQAAELVAALNMRTIPILVTLQLRDPQARPVRVMVFQNILSVCLARERIVQAAAPVLAGRPLPTIIMAARVDQTERVEELRLKHLLQARSLAVRAEVKAAAEAAMLRMQT